jgi:hypothetical protein
MSEQQKKPVPHVRALAKEEARERVHELRLAITKMAAAHLAKYEERWEKSDHTDLHALHGALFLLQTQLPQWLFTGLRQVVERSMRGPSVDEVRWLMVRQALDHPELRLTWEKAYEYVSEQLKKTDAHGAADTIKKSYQKIERSLPPEKRRSATHRRRDKRDR